MKKVLLICFALLIVFAFASCAGKTETEAPSDTASAGNSEETQPAQTEAPDTTADGVSESAAQAAAALIPGTLYQLDDAAQPALRGLSLSGNRSGSAEFNAAEPAAEGIRCIFELNEWVEVTPDTDVQEGLAVWVFSHREDPDAYKSAAFSEETPGFAGYCELPFDPDAEAGASRGSFYLNPEDCEAGFYDLVFTVDGKAAAVLLTRFYNEPELEEKTDAELAQLMTGLQ